jgi:hypothetical protein
LSVIPEYNLVCVVGDTFKADFKITDESNNPVNLSGSTLFVVCDMPNLNFAITSAANGEFRLWVTAADSANLQPSRYPYRLGFIWSNGDKETLLVGAISVVKV